MLESRVPVVSVCAVRTGSGKSQTTRRVVRILRDKGRKVVAVRHPMPYGEIARQRVQRFAHLEDLDRHRCTIEEREEYEPHLAQGTVVYAGVDYGAILREAEGEADVVLWDGGNNDLPFFRSDLEIVVADPHRPGHELRYWPGEANVRRAHVLVINKVSTADPEAVAVVRRNLKALNPKAVLVEADSRVTLSDPEAVRGKRVLVIEDGPTLTHGEMAYGAGVIAACTGLWNWLASPCILSSRSLSSTRPTRRPSASTGSCETSASRMRWNAVSKVSSGATLTTLPSSERREIRSRRSPCAVRASSPWSSIHWSL